MLGLKRGAGRYSHGGKAADNAESGIISHAVPALSERHRDPGAGSAGTEGREMKNPLMVLTQAAAEWQHCSIPAEVDWATRRAVLDWFGAMLPVCIDGPAVTLENTLESARGEGNAICYTDGRNGSARHA